MPSEGIVYRSGKKKLQKKATKLSLADQISQNRARGFSSSNNYSARSGKSNKTGSDLESVDISHLTKQDDSRRTPTPLPTVNPQNTRDKEPVRKSPYTNKNDQRNIEQKERPITEQNKTMPYQNNHMKQVLPPMHHNSGQRNRNTGSSGHVVTLPPIQDNNKITGTPNSGSDQPRDLPQKHHQPSNQDYNNNARYADSQNDRRRNDSDDRRRRDYSKEKSRTKSPSKRDDKRSSRYKERSKSPERNQRRSNSRDHISRRRSKSRDRGSKYTSKDRGRSKSKDRNRRHGERSHERDRKRRSSSRERESRQRKNSRDRGYRHRSKSPDRKHRRRSRSESKHRRTERKRSKSGSKSRTTRYRSKSRSSSRDRHYKRRHDNKHDEYKRHRRSSRSYSRERDDKHKLRSNHSIKSNYRRGSDRSSSYDYHYRRQSKNNSKYKHDMSDTDDYYSDADHPNTRRKKQHRTHRHSDRILNVQNVESRPKERKVVILNDNESIYTSDDENRTIYIRSKSQHEPRRNRKINISKEYYSDAESRRPDRNIVYYTEEPVQAFVTPRNTLPVPNNMRQVPVQVANNTQREDELFYLVPANTNVRHTQNQINVPSNAPSQNHLHLVQPNPQNNTGQQLYYVNKTDAVYGQEPMYDAYRQPVQQKFYNQHTNHYRHENTVPNNDDNVPQSHHAERNPTTDNTDNVSTNEPIKTISNQTHDSMPTGRTPDGKSSASGQSYSTCEDNESRMSSREDDRVSTAEKRRALKHWNELSNYNIDVARGKTIGCEPPMTDETLIKKIFNDEFQVQMDEYLRS